MTSSLDYHHPLYRRGITENSRLDDDDPNCSLPSVHQEYFFIIVLPSSGNFMLQDEVFVPAASTATANGEGLRLLYWGAFRSNPGISLKDQRRWHTRVLTEEEICPNDRVPNEEICMNYLEMKDVEEIVKSRKAGAFDSSSFTTRALCSRLSSEFVEFMFGVGARNAVASKISEEAALRQSYSRVKSSQEQDSAYETYDLAGKHTHVYFLCDSDEEDTNGQMAMMGRLWRHVPSYVLLPTSEDFIEYLEENMNNFDRECVQGYNLTLLSALAGAVGRTLQTRNPGSSKYLMIINADHGYNEMQFIQIGYTQENRMWSKLTRCSSILKELIDSGYNFKCPMSNMVHFLYEYIKTKVAMPFRNETAIDSALHETQATVNKLLSDQLASTDLENEDLTIVLTGGKIELLLLCYFLTGSIDENLGEDNLMDVPDKPYQIMTISMLKHEGLLHVLRFLKQERDFNDLSKTNGGVNVARTFDDQYIGKRISKKFSDGIYYDGTISQCDLIHDRKFWLVAYDDGDAEHLVEDDVKLFIKKFNDRAKSSKSKERKSSIAKSPASSEVIPKKRDRAKKRTTKKKGKTPMQKTGKRIKDRNALQDRLNVTPSKNEFLNRKVAKYFGDHLYMGVISEKFVIDGRMVWHIIYEDGDEEDMEFSELVASLTIYQINFG